MDFNIFRPRMEIRLYFPEVGSFLSLEKTLLFTSPFQITHEVCE